MTKELEQFLDQWTEDATGTKPLFEALYAWLRDAGAELSYRGRPGVSHSLRAVRPGDTERDLFVLVDVIDDDPAERWLSVCFYADLVTDPEERGDVVPGGLAGADARCFDVDAPDAAARVYLVDRLAEAWERAGRREG